ncbi:MAG TPA: PstS family phosphate ABC transporter substrate-binding protein [Bacteroidales bacterium]|nr:PstS family phosphate ABC transporter substrate-binding protein [Bacteroidales bacterium]
MRRSLLVLFTILVLVPCGLLIQSGCNQSADESAASRSDTLKGKITISGAFALYPLTVKWAEEFQKLHPRVTVNVSAGGAGKGMTDALTGMVDLGMFSKSVSPEEQAKGAWWIAVAKDAVLPTVNKENPVLNILKGKGLTRQKLYDIFITGKIKTWGQATGTNSTVDLQAFTRSDACGASDMWAKFLNNKKQEDLLGLGVNGDPGVADAVRKNVEGIGYNNLGFIYEMQSRKIYDGIEVVPLDLNENGKIDPDENFYGTMDDVMKAINEGRYPSPPARDLYFVSKGEPVNPLVRSFLRWVLSDGQKFVTEAGYVMISPDKINLEFLDLK